MTSLGQLRAARRTGAESFHAAGRPLEFDLLDFWRWSVSDLVSNATRGRLAEYLVARALNIPTSGVRDEWAPHDLETADGRRLEVKSAGFVQSWHQSKLSTIGFIVRKSRRWDPETNEMATEPTRQADACVFALFKHTEKSTVDPLDLTQWCFYVVPTRIIDERTRSPHSITLRSLERLDGAGPFGFDDLGAAVDNLVPRPARA